jgi:hypothetical protein
MCRIDKSRVGGGDAARLLKVNALKKYAARTIGGGMTYFHDFQSH